MSEVKVDSIGPRVDSGTLTIGASGDTITIPSGATLANAGTVTGLPASAISSGTMATARLGSGTASSSTFLRGDQTYAAAGGANTPAFEAFSTSDQAVSDNTTTKVECGTEVYDTANNYDKDSNYRFTPQTAGKFFCYGQVFIETPAQSGGTGATLLRQPTAYIYKNGAIVGACQNNFIDSQIKQFTATVSTVIDMNGSSDYIELYCYFDGDGGATGSIEGHASQRRTMFGAYKIII